MSTKPDQPFTAQESRAYSILRDLVRGEARIKIYRTISEDPTSKTALLEGLLDDDSKFDEYLRQYFAEKKEDLKKDLNILASDSTLKKRCSQIAESLVSAAIGATPRTIMDSLNLRVICVGPLTDARIADFVKLVDGMYPGFEARIDEHFRVGGNMAPEQDLLDTVGMGNEAECRMLINVALGRGTAICRGMTRKRAGMKAEVVLAGSSGNATGMGGPVDVTTANGKIYSFTGIVDFIFALSEDRLRDLPAQLVSIAAARALQMAILEVKPRMTEEELKRHFPQLATQAIVTIKVLRWNALACILSDGFQYIFAVMECVDETSDKYQLYYYDSLLFIHDRVPALDKAKKLLAMMVCWVVLTPAGIKLNVKRHRGLGNQSGI
ncbi:hypothetical protein CC2G_012393 [Coprinopsis cinerea AmutBmut pab1-1]|nr:hypothetical protein CC2G_012393 [Coprinopsis cinerea AmutBmut pab1-1]